MGEPEKPPQITLEHVMEWAFAHEPNSFTPLMLASLLDGSISIPDMEKKVSIKHLGHDRGRLSKTDKDVVEDVFKKKKHPVVSMYCRDVLVFMNELYLHQSTPPPPWRT